MCWLHKRRRNRHKDKGVRTMSLMGYTEKEVEEMRKALIIASLLVKHPYYEDKLMKTADFLDGLLVEGRI